MAIIAESDTTRTSPDIAGLGRWLYSWVQPSGALHGFHSHPVTGGNPYRCRDTFAGHCTAAAPFLMGLAAACRQHPDDRGLAVLKQTIRFQMSELQRNGGFDHAAFQAGEKGAPSLFQNMLASTALSETAAILLDGLGNELLAQIDKTVHRHMAGCGELMDRFSDTHLTATRYMLCWARLAHMRAFNHAQWLEDVRKDLDYLVTKGHLFGVPDGASAGLLAEPEERAALATGDLCGLVIHPLLLGWEQLEESRYFETAQAVARHLVRSSWRDLSKRRRLHRSWIQPASHDRVNNQAPMAIGGIGLALSGIQRLFAVDADPEFEAFLDEMDRTYSAYQSFSGFFLPATGWYSEADVVPSTAMQAHDFYHLVVRHGVDEQAAFWDRMLAESTACSVVIGRNWVWLEDRHHWALRGFRGMNDASVVGSKARPVFAVQIDGTAMPEQLAEFVMPEEPRFVHTDEGVFHCGGRMDLQVFVAGNIAYSGPRLTGQLRTAGLSLPRRNADGIDATTLQLSLKSVQGRAKILAATDLFRDLTHEEIRELASNLEERPFRQGETVIRQGDEGDTMFVLADGQMEVIVEGNADRPEVRIARAEPGEVLGEMSLLTGEKRSATVIARSHVLAYEIDRELMSGLFAKRPQVAMAVSTVVAERKLQRELAISTMTEKEKTEILESPASGPLREAADQIMGSISKFFHSASDAVEEAVAGKKPRKKK